MGTDTATPPKEKHMETTENVPQIFSFKGKEVRTVLDSEENALFNANDICAFLEYANPHQAIGLHVDQDDLCRIEVIDSMGRNQVSNFVTEFGLYDLILGSRKKEAKEFKRWVTHEVLPSIRKTGGYHVTIPREQFNDMMSTAIKGPAIDRIRLQQTKEELSLKRAANRQMALENRVEVNNLKERIAILERKIDRLRDGGLKAKEQWDRWCNTRQWVYLDFHYLD